jgi:predicted transcriptional regulator
VKLREIIELVKGSILTSKGDLNLEIPSCGASDLMSDALAFMKPGDLLLTGLIHPQVVRTAEMAELAAVVFVRGKTPSLDTIELAKELGIPLVASPYGMYEMCGLLYGAGLEATLKNDF